MKRMIFSLIAGSVPAAAVLFLLSQAIPPVKPDVVDFRSGRAVEAEIPDTDDFNFGTKSFLARLGETDAAQCVRLLKRIEMMEEGEEKSRTRKLVFYRLAECDREEALTYAEKLWSGRERLQLIAPVIAKWGHEEPDVCWNWIESNAPDFEKPPQQLQNGWIHLLREYYVARSFCEPSPAEIERTWTAVREALEIDSNRRYRHGLRVRNGLFGDPVPEGSLWVLSNHAAMTGDWEGVVGSLADLNGVTSLSLVHVSHRWMAADMEAALGWANGLTDPKKRAMVFESMIPGRSSDPDPEASVPLDSKKYFEWLAKNAPDEAARQIGNHVKQGAEWLANQPAEAPEFDQARAKLSFALVNSDIDRAIAWAEAVIDEKARQGALRSLVFQWNREDSRAARRFARERLGWSEAECEKKLR